MELKFSMKDLMSQITPEDIQKERIALCRACDSYKPTLHLCGECGCQVDAKTRMAMTTCPLFKWMPVQVK